MGPIARLTTPRRSLASVSTHLRVPLTVKANGAATVNATLLVEAATKPKLLQSLMKLCMVVQIAATVTDQLSPFPAIPTIALWTAKGRGTVGAFAVIRVARLVCAGKHFPSMLVLSTAAPPARKHMVKNDRTLATPIRSAQLIVKAVGRRGLRALCVVKARLSARSS